MGKAIAIKTLRSILVLPYLSKKKESFFADRQILQAKVLRNK
jgi:hypothetical protein